ncbi:43984_t:CDS:2, partial [Gigaspora margarita]
ELVNANANSPQETILKKDNHHSARSNSVQPEDINWQQNNRQNNCKTSFKMRNIEKKGYYTIACEDLEKLKRERSVEEDIKLSQTQKKIKVIFRRLKRARKLNRIHTLVYAYYLGEILENTCGKKNKNNDNQNDFDNNLQIDSWRISTTEEELSQDNDVENGLFQDTYTMQTPIILTVDQQNENYELTFQPNINYQSLPNYSGDHSIINNQLQQQLQNALEFSIYFDQQIQIPNISQAYTTIEQPTQIENMIVPHNNQHFHESTY